MTTENLKNPSVPILPNPQDLDLAIQTLQLELAVLPWLDKSFGRAYIMPSTVLSDTKRLEPKVYQGKSEYYPVLPNDALRSYSFFRVVNARESENDGALSPNSMFEATKVDLICWVDLKKIDRTKDYIFTEELINDVRKILSKSPNVTLLKVWDERAENVFKGYTLEPNHRDLLMYPFSAFRIELNLKYSLKCI